VFKKVLYNTGAQTLGKIVTASATLLITLIIGRSLGPALFGEFTKIFVYVGYFYVLVDFGLNSIFVKESQDKNTSNLFKSLLGLRLVLATQLTLLAIIISFFLPYDAQTLTGFSPLVKTGIIIASLTILTQALFATGSAFFQKNLRYDLSAVATILGSMVMVAITFILFFKTRLLLPYIFVYVIGGATYTAASYYLIWRKFRQNLRPTYELNQLKTLLSLSWPIGIALVLNLLYFRIDVLILANFRESAEVGLYGLGYQFFQAGLAVPIFFANALYPILARQYSQKSSEFKKTIKTWSVYLFLFSLALTVFLIAISYLIPVLYDVRFAGSATALRILSIGMPAFFMSALIWHLLIIYGRQKLLIYIYAIGAVFNLISNLILIPRFGYLAAATTTVVSEILILVLLLGALKGINFSKRS